ncbi:MAG TPA: hypothetical protein VMU77_01585 [Acidimicrobiales bacterium]|nr:hypothetical protein [Acidimicrobiales bacterium]
MSIAASYLLLAVICYWSAWSNHPSHTTLAGADQFQNAWNLTWIPYAVLHLHNPFHTQYLNYPSGANLLTNTSAPMLGLIASPITLLFGPIAAFNAMLTLGMAGSACTTYVLARKFVAWRPAAYVGGLIFGFSPYVIGHGVGQLNLEFVAFIPLIFLVLYEIVVVHHDSYMKWGLLLAGILLAQFFTSSELLIDTSVVVLIAMIVLAISNRRSLNQYLPTIARTFAVAIGGFIVVAAWPIWFALHGAGHISGPVQLVPQAYRADLFGSFVPDGLQHFGPPASMLAQANLFASNPVENGSYLGIPLLLLLGIGTLAYRRSKAVLFAALMGTVAFVLSMGAGLVIRVKPDAAGSGIWLPEKLLSKLPLLSNIIPVRFTMIEDLFAAVLVALLLCLLNESLKDHELSGVVQVAVPAVVAVASILPLIPAVPYSGMVSTAPPEVFSSRAAAIFPNGSTAVVFPYPVGLNQDATLWQADTFMRFKMPGGNLFVPDRSTGKVAYSGTFGYTQPTTIGTAFLDLSTGVDPPNSFSFRNSVLTQLFRWKVRTLVAVPSLAPNPQQVVSYISWLTGGSSPNKVGTAYIWHLPRR